MAEPVEKGAADRRDEARIALGVPIVLRTDESAVMGRTVDISLGGFQLELYGTLGDMVREVVVEVADAGFARPRVRAVVVRRALTREGRPLVALRLVPGRVPQVYDGPALCSRAPAPRPPDAAEIDLARRQLKALGTRVLELALDDGEAAPPTALVAWVGRLARELGVDAPADVSTTRALFRGIVAMHRGVSTRPVARAA